MENKFSIKLYKNETCFGIGQSGDEVIYVLEQLKKHNVIKIDRLAVKKNSDQYLKDIKDTFILKVFKDDEVIEERISWITSYQEITTNDNVSVIIIENATLITKK